MSRTICIYHGNCADGFASAWVVRKALGGVNVEFVAGTYGATPPDVAGRSVLIVDFSFKRPVMEEMAAQAENVIILDHHKTAVDELQPLLDDDRLDGVLDVSRSGAMITWDYFFPGIEPPKLLRHIQDRDLWQFKLPCTREIQANVFSWPYSFEAWDVLMAMDVELLIHEGNAIERKHHKDVNELIGVVTRRMVIGGYNVPVANLPYTMVSDAAGQLAVGEPFGACYWDTPRGRVFGLRSTEGVGIDVAEVAKGYGGGGHKHASGFTLPFALAQELEVPSAETAV